MPVRVEQLLRSTIDAPPPTHQDQPSPRLHLEVVIEGKLYQSFDATKKFVELAFNKGAHKQQPAHTSQPRWERRKRYVQSYCFSDATLSDIGKAHGQTKENVRQIIKIGIRNLWNNSSPQMQQLFPLKLLTLGKPLPQAKREQRSLARGALALRVRALLQEGETSREIVNTLGLSSQQLSNVRSTLLGWGETSLPYMREGLIRNRELEAALRDKTKGDDEVQKLLRQVTRDFYLSHTRGRADKPLFMSVSNVAPELQIKARNAHLLVEALKQANPPIPVGKVVHEVKSDPQKREQHYFFILSRQRERARTALLADETLQPFLQPPLELLCGYWNVVLPTTNSLVHSGGFRSPKHIFAEVGLQYWRPQSNVSLPDFLGKDCPVPIFSYGRRRRKVYYPVEQEALLRAFVARKARELATASNATLSRR